MSRISVVYFSKDNNTRTGALYIGEHEEANVTELIETKKGNFIQAILKRKSKLEGNPWQDIKDAELVYLMMPIWASNGVPAMNAFIEKADFTDKKVRIITFQQFANLKNSESVHEYVSKIVTDKGGKVIDTYGFLGGKMGHCMPKEQIEAQVCTIFYNKEYQGANE